MSTFCDKKYDQFTRVETTDNYLDEPASPGADNHFKAAEVFR